jgi:hypothetical protein
MYLFLLLLTLLAGPFWESKAPGAWTDEELLQLLTDSPWAQAMGVSVPSQGAPVLQVYIATAGPIDVAERERDLRAKRRAPAQRQPENPPDGDSLAAEYRVWLEENHSTQIVLAVRMENNRGFSDEKETRRMEEDSVMRVGRKRFKMTGHFPPSTGDPYLRLAFPRQVTLADKAVSFDLYLPGVAIPFRTVDFKVKDMIVRGRLEI